MFSRLLRLEFDGAEGYRTSIASNGGANWDREFKEMADALLTHLGSGKPLPAAELKEVATIVSEVKRNMASDSLEGTGAVFYYSETGRYGLHPGRWAWLLGRRGVEIRIMRSCL